MDPHIVVSIAQKTELIELLQNVSVGAGALFSLMWLNLFFIRRIALTYEINAWVNLAKKRFNRVFIEYFLGVTYLLFVQIAAIIVWAVILHLLGLSKDPGAAILFAGSCYTTMGIVNDVLPEGWKMLAVVIALSGYFAIALTTASMLGMGLMFRKAWRLKHADKIRLLLKRKGIQIPFNADINDLWEETTLGKTNTSEPRL